MERRRQREREQQQGQQSIQISPSQKASSSSSPSKSPMKTSSPFFSKSSVNSPSSSQVSNLPTKTSNTQQHAHQTTITNFFGKKQQIQSQQTQQIKSPQSQPNQTFQHSFQTTPINASQRKPDENEDQIIEDEDDELPLEILLKKRKLQQSHSTISHNYVSPHQSTNPSVALPTVNPRLQMQINSPTSIQTTTSVPQPSTKKRKLFIQDEEDVEDVEVLQFDPNSIASTQVKIFANNKNNVSNLTQSNSKANPIVTNSNPSNVKTINVAHITSNPVAQPVSKSKSIVIAIDEKGKGLQYSPSNENQLSQFAAPTIAPMQQVATKNSSNRSPSPRLSTPASAVKKVSEPSKQMSTPKQLFPVENVKSINTPKSSTKLSSNESTSKDRWDWLEHPRDAQKRTPGDISDTFMSTNLGR